MKWFKKLFESKPKPKVKVCEREIVYSPKKNITSYEVAKCLELFEFTRRFGHLIKFEDLKKKLQSYPKSIQRHFKVIEKL